MAILWVILSSINIAHAAFYVHDDTSSITTLYPFEVREESTAYIAFYGSRISKTGQIILRKMVNRSIAADTIHINAYGKTRTQFSKAKQRVATVKSWLVKQGVTETKIQTYTRLDPSNDINDTTVKITMSMTTAQLPSPSSAAHTDKRHTGSASQMASIKKLPRAWTLNANKSLHDNLDNWAKIAGYEKPVWGTEKPYKVAYTSMYTGTFLEALSQVSTLVPDLDFVISKSHHTLRVLDAKH